MLLLYQLILGMAIKNTRGKTEEKEKKRKKIEDYAWLYENAVVL